ncbi:MAG TPA: ATP-binding protein [Terriglobales bacterium]|nr:ATP-binding protein [Terriglobales bacterium]
MAEVGGTVEADDPQVRAHGEPPSNGRPIQGSLFEEHYLVRSLGLVASAADVALTELVANAWDAGATEVNILLPKQRGEFLTIEDDGCGLTAEQFKQRWMTLGYDRVRHQGRNAELPPERSNLRRTAYGRNGVGRHGLLCFADRYEVDSRRDGKRSHFVVSAAAGTAPFVLMSERVSAGKGHGTTLTAVIERNLPSPDRIRDVLSARFLHDPQFRVLVNGSSVPLEEHVGLADRAVITPADGVRAEAFFIDSTKMARTTRHQGVAFWVGGRLVGTPSWSLGDRMVIDGRTRFAKRYTVVVKSDDLFDEVLPDWSAFKKSEIVTKMYEAVASYVEGRFKVIYAERIQDTKESVFREHRVEIEALTPGGRADVAEFVEQMAAQQPTVQPETMSLAVKTMIQLEQSRSGAALLDKLSRLTDEDIEGLDRLLSDWTVRDALTVLDEIDRRIAIVEAMGKLSTDRKVDELHTLHPLVTQARWLFGPEFDAAEYASNLSLRRAVEKVFKKKVKKASSFINHRKRPDLLIQADFTLSAVATEEFDSGGLTKLRDILLIELKKGGSCIGRDEVTQAEHYVEDLIGCGLLDGAPFIRAFVVGDEVDQRVQSVRTIGANPERGRIQTCTYGQLVRTALQRLFRLRERLGDRYDDASGTDLLQRVLKEPKQQELL